MRIDGHDVGPLRDGRLSALRGRRIGFVFQQFHLLEGLTALENVANGLLYAGVPRRRRLAPGRRRRSTPSASAAGRDHRPGELSGGERQRVGIARALVGDPAIVLADEPTGNLDCRTGDAIIELLLASCTAPGRTIVLITHDREIAARAPPRVAIRDGRIVDDVRGGGVTTVAAQPGCGRPSTSLADRATVGLRSRRLRTALTALGIAIGIAAMVAVVGISSSSRADVHRRARRPRHRPAARRARPDRVRRRRRRCRSRRGDTAARIGPVTAAAGLTSIDATVRRTDLDRRRRHRRDPRRRRRPDHARRRPAPSSPPAGSSTPRRRDCPTVGARRRRRRAARDPRSSAPACGCGCGGEWFVVIGILEPAPLAPELDSAALIGYPVAEHAVRDHDVAVDPVRAHGPRPGRGGARRARPVDPPRDAERGRRVAPVRRPRRPGRRPTPRCATCCSPSAPWRCVVGGVGITNVMVISVLERRAEIGVRRALGARRTHIAGQFLAESACAGAARRRRRGRARRRGHGDLRRDAGWLVDVPVGALAAGAGLALAVGLLAGVSPAIRAARLDPADAIRPA